MQHPFNNIRNITDLPPLAWAMVISFLLHAILLLLVKWPTVLTPQNLQPRLTVSLFPRHSTPPLLTQALPKQVKNKILYQASSPSKATLPSQISATSTVDTPQTNQSLDMGQLLNQAREYAKSVRTTAPKLEVFGDYYGTYNGSDNGTFYFQLDQSLHATGSGQSNKYGVSFIIAGSASSDGIIQMTGTGMAGDAKFTGRINIQTRQVSGEWQLVGLGRGEFFGKHE